MRGKVNDAAFPVAARTGTGAAGTPSGPFVPHYAMVSFMRIPYSVALHRSDPARDPGRCHAAGCDRLEAVEPLRPRSTTDAAVLAKRRPCWQTRQWRERQLLFYDLGPSAPTPRRSRIAQFAAIRTDEALNRNRRADLVLRAAGRRLLPSPVATLITGIARRTHCAMASTKPPRSPASSRRWRDRRPAAPATTRSASTTNSSVTACTRNFHDAYERRWKAGNSRWDVLDALRLMHAFAPEGIAWRQRRGRRRHQLQAEHLAEDNGLRMATRTKRQATTCARYRPPVPPAPAAAVGLRAAPAQQALRRVPLDTTDMTLLLRVAALSVPRACARRQ